MRQGFPEDFGLGSSLTPESVRKWREHTAAFFAREWTDLHAIVRRMEEELWSAEAVSSPEGTFGDPLFNSVTDNDTDADRSVDERSANSVSVERPAGGGLFRDVNGTTHESRAVARNSPPEEPAGGGLFRDVNGTTHESRAAARNSPPEEPAAAEHSRLAELSRRIEERMRLARIDEQTPPGEANS